MKAGRARTTFGMARTLQLIWVVFCILCRCPHEPGGAAALPDPPIRSSPLLLPMILQLQAKAKGKRRELGVGDHVGGTPAVLVACLFLLVGGAHKTVEETRKKGTNRPYMDIKKPLVLGREDVESRSLPAFSAPESRRAKGALGVPPEHVHLQRP